MQVGRYIYGFIEESKRKEFSFPGIGEKKVYTVNYQDLAAVVSEAEIEEYDPTRKNVRTHTQVQEKIMKDYTLLPMSFGIVAENEEKIKKLLEKSYDEFKDELKRLNNKIELGVKVFWEKEAMTEDLEGESEKLSKLKEKIKAASAGEARQMLIKAGQMVERMAQDWKVKYAERVYKSLKELSLDACLNDPIDIKNILNASFLLDKDKEEEFDQRINELNAQYGDKTTFKYVGPMPPYNFVDIKVRL